MMIWKQSTAAMKILKSVKDNTEVNAVQKNCLKKKEIITDQKPAYTFRRTDFVAAYRYKIASGAFPRFFKIYAPACGLSLNDAIERVTFLPARTLGLSNKGTLKIGADADLVIFDPERITDNSTFSHPTSPPDGISWVIINGQTAAKDGKITNGKLGRALRIQSIR